MGVLGCILGDSVAVHDGQRLGRLEQVTYRETSCPGRLD